MSSVLTQAEEHGLRGFALDSRLRQIFYNLSADRLFELSVLASSEARTRQMLYYRNGLPEVIEVMLRPAGAMPDQVAYCHIVSLTLINALKRFPDLYIQDAAIRETVPLMPDEEKWVLDTWGPGHRENNPIFGRLDAMVDFTSPTWKDSLHFIEPNLSGVGGIHYAPNCEQLVAELTLPILREVAPDLHLDCGVDLRELFIQEVNDHLEAVGRPGGSVCFMDPKYAGDGPMEFPALVEHYREMHGIKVAYADPSELYIKNGEVWYEDTRIDIAYRDCEIRDLLALEKEEGLNVEPCRVLFRENRMISSIAGDFDHKSCWEIFTDPRFTSKYFTADDRRTFRRHILWTRLLRDCRTTDPEGQAIDLLEWVRRNQDMLVIKPNRSYGGDRVAIGPSVSEGEWEEMIEGALQGESFVAQRLAHITVSEFPVVGPDGKVSIEPFYLVAGFAPTQYGVAIIGRASQKQVVNVAQGGGSYAILINQYTQPSHGKNAP